MRLRSSPTGANNPDDLCARERELRSFIKKVILSGAWLPYKGNRVLEGVLP